MSLERHFTRSGSHLFRWRSYVPLFPVTLLLLQYRHFHYPRGSHHLAQLWSFLCLGISLAGLGVRAVTIGHAPPGTSGRSTRGGMGADMLSTTGTYSLVRHPLYLGNALMWLGIALLPRIWWLTLVIMLFFALYYERIMFSEEAFLRSRFGQVFEEWARTTPAFWPKLRGWRPPRRDFSARAVLHREPSALLAMLACFTVFDLCQDLEVRGRRAPDPVWPGIFTAGLVLYLVLRVATRRKPRGPASAPRDALEPLGE